MLTPASLQCENKGNYSLLSHLADAIYGRNRNHEGLLIVALTVYLDASGTRSSGQILVVSGFVSTERQWRRFERDWIQVLSASKLAYFRMSEYNSYSGEFANWRNRERQRTALLKNLISLTAKYALQSFSAAVLLRDWRRCNEVYRLEESGFAPYAMCGWTCVESVFEWRKGSDYAKEPTLFIFEDGDKDKGQLEDSIKRDFGVRIRFGGKMPTFQEPAILPLQAGDFAAWHVRKVFDDYEANKLERFREDFKSLFTKMPTNDHHRYFRMKPGREVIVPPTQDTAFMQKSIGIPSLVKFAIDRRIPQR